MSNLIELPRSLVDIRIGDCLDLLRDLPDESIDCCVTSPPYFNLRNYGIDRQIGLEKTVEEYVAKLVDVFREVRRALKPDATLWLNLGDSYARDGGVHHGRSDNQRGVGVKRAHDAGYGDQGRGLPKGAKPKDLLMIPARVALALQADGWWLRSDVIWQKKSPVPESVRDRFTCAHEHVFLLTKSPTYFFDAKAVAEPSVMRPQNRLTRRSAHPKGDAGRQEHTKPPGGTCYETRNRRNVWTIASKPFKGYDFEGADYVDDRGIPRKLSPNCPVHAPPEQLHPEITEAASCDARVDRPDVHMNSDSHPALEPWLSGDPIARCTESQPRDILPKKSRESIVESKIHVSPLGEEEGRIPVSNGGILPVPGSSMMDCDLHGDSLTANASNSQSYKTDPSLGSFEHDTLFGVLPESIQHTELERASTLLCERISWSKIEAHQPSSHAKENVTPLPLSRMSHIQSGKSSIQYKCSCVISQVKHFAVMPSEIASICILAGSSAEGHCASCGVRWCDGPQCACLSDDPAPDVVLDPFGGAGTTGLVAQNLGRRAILLELNPDYAKIARQRCA